MTRELDMQVAAALGIARWVSSWTDGARMLVLHSDEEYRDWPDADQSLPVDGADLPHYSTSLNACAQAEALIIERGLGEKYAYALYDVLEAWNFDWVTQTAWKVATASAETRCLAILKVLEAQP